MTGPIPPARLASLAKARHGVPEDEDDPFSDLIPGGGEDEDPFADIQPAVPRHPYARLWDTAARPALQGLTLGFSDEIRGLGAKLIPGGDDYTTARDKERAALKRARDEAPITSKVSELGGGLATPLGAFGKLAKGAGYGRKILTGAKVGATTGALAGAGYSEGETPGDVLLHSLVGSLAGGIGGAAVPALVGGPGAIVRAGERAGMTRNRLSDLVADQLEGLNVHAKPVGTNPLLHGAGAVADKRVGLPPDAYAEFMGKVKKGPTPRTRTGGAWGPQAVPSTPPPPSAAALEELAARKQRGPTRAQFKWREDRYGLPKVTPDPPAPAPREPVYEPSNYSERLALALARLKATGKL